ncbi:sporulation membrane protein YtaF [Paenibacillus sp. J2TS4]|uniref:sporulation membrane protein YtaF n=1 Tax=Paenibacillus sp. J2TS4 TaxID=2807194 RepID=UPI001B21FCF7|nr:sporulation membrane protein YtaF [Paenibacillus sp. J2TS4]GIP33736.1 sporulation membrane protein YtaF [Paenibacillus sp. J2TS4]
MLTMSLLILALAVSLDGFGVGATYGLRQIKIPVLSIVIIALCSGITILLSMQIGDWLSRLFSPSMANALGAFILIGIGIWSLYQIFPKKDEAKERPDSAKLATSEASAAQDQEGNEALVRIELKRMGLVIQILKTPSVADIDRSGIISPSEAALLGLALSLDAFGAGIGAALLGYNPYVTSTVIAVSSGAFLAAGLNIGLRFAGLTWMRKMSILPGCFLIIIGIIKLL